MIPQRVFSGVCEITSGVFSITQLPPAYTGETGALAVEISFTYEGESYTIPSGVTAEMYLKYPNTDYMTTAVPLDIDDDTVTGSLSDVMTCRSGYPLLVIQLTDSSTGSLIVATATPIKITNVRGDLVIDIHAPNPSEIQYVGKAPYVDTTSKIWYEWDNDAGQYVSTGILARGRSSYINTSNNHWMVYDDETQSYADSGILAVGVGTASVNNVLPDSNGNVALKGTDIPMSGTDSTNVKTAIDNASAVMTGASASSAGAKGQVPAPSAGDNTKYLRGDGTWQVVTTADMTGATSSTAGTHGLVPAPVAGDDTKFLSGDGTWKTVEVADKVLVIDIESFNSLPQTVEDPSIKANHICIKATLSNPLAQDGEWTVDTSAGELEVTGSILDSTDLTLYLIEAETA